MYLGGGKQNPIFQSFREVAFVTDVDCYSLLYVNNVLTYNARSDTYNHDERVNQNVPHQQQQPPPSPPPPSPPLQQQPLYSQTTRTSHTTPTPKPNLGGTKQTTTGLFSAPLTSRLALCTSRCLSNLLCTYETTCWLETRSHTPSHAKIKNASSG